MNRSDLSWFLALFIVCLTVVYLFTCGTTIKDDNVKLTKKEAWKDRLRKNNIQIGLSTKDKCETLFDNADTDLQKRSASYSSKKAEFEDHLKRLKPGQLEGHTGTKKEQHLFYWVLGGMNHVRTICEIGFNAGHSALVWLESNPNVHLYSLDLNVHKYTAPMASYLKSLYPNRFDIFYGESDRVVPMVSQKEHLSCDILVVDGGHFGDQAFRDIVNMKKMAHKASLLVVDDTSYASDWGKPVMESINKLLACNYIKSEFLCSYGSKPGGFSIFTYNRDDSDNYCNFIMT